MSSWGYKGYCEVWCEGSNDWIYPHLHEGADRMVELAHLNGDHTPLRRRALVRSWVKSGRAAASLPAEFRAGITGGQAVEHRLELALEHAQLGHLLVDLAYPPGQERAQAGPQGPALAGRPRNEQGGDVLQAHADALGPADERQLVQGRLVEHPVAVGCPPGR